MKTNRHIIADILYENYNTAYADAFDVAWDIAKKFNINPSAEYKSGQIEPQVTQKIAEEVCLHKNKRYEQQFTCEEIYCKDCGEYLGISG